MGKYLLKKILISIMTIFVILLIMFLLLQFMPGSPFNDDKLSPEQIEMMRQKYGLDQPVIIRFFRYVANMFKGDLGVSYSISANTPITTLIARRFPVTMEIGLVSLCIGTFAGVVLGLLSAFFRSRVMNVIYSVLTLIGIAVPSYLLAMFLSYCLGFRANLLPMLYDVRDPFTTSIMPVAALSFMVMAIIGQFTKAEAMDVMNSDYVLLARCQGLKNSTIMVKYILRNSLIPVITMVGNLLVGLLTGSLVIEQMFSIPGIGTLLTQAISSNDYNVVLGLCFLYSGMYITVRLVLDILYCFADPRVRLGGTKS